MTSTTFGYHTQEDRIWVSNTDWDDRVWLTRYTAQRLLQHLSDVLEQGHPTNTTEATARAHHAAINHTVQGHGRPLSIGRESAVQASQRPSSATLCRGFQTADDGDMVDLHLQTDHACYQLQQDRSSLHRWLHALWLIVKQADWNLPQPPDWLSRSYLPEALRNIWEQPMPDGLLDDDEPPRAEKQ